MQVMLFTAAIDDRYGAGVIKSRIGLSADAHVFDADTQFTQLVRRQLKQEKLACILVDEAQFLTQSQVDQLAALVDTADIPVLCYGIRTDFQGELFAGSSRLLAIADKLFELKTVCECGRKATMTVRLDEQGKVIADGDQVQIGGNERYESKCRRHHSALMQSAKNSANT